MKKYVKKKIFCGIVIPSKKDKILTSKQNMKPDKMPYIIYADIESLIKKKDECVNNPENSSATKTGQHIPCGYSISIIQAFNKI